MILTVMITVVILFGKVGVGAFFMADGRKAKNWCYISHQLESSTGITLMEKCNEDMN